MALLIHGAEATNVFRLQGGDENSATFAVGWTLEQSPEFRRQLFGTIRGGRVDSGSLTITLQRHGKDGGFTDLEAFVEQDLHCIIEAKKGWGLPSVEQLQRYSPRLKESNAAYRAFISVSAAPLDYARRILPCEVNGFSIGHLSWTQLRRFAANAYAKTSKLDEKLWLRELIAHLGEYVAMDRVRDNRVFVVSLNASPVREDGTHTWIDVVEKDRCYYHPVRKGWPSQPPNYMGFRYRGGLQSVHHVDSFEIVEDVSKINCLWLGDSCDHFVYRLGPAMRPIIEMKTGKIFRNGRVWCDIDTLLSGAWATISEARSETQRRENAAREE